MRQTTYHKKRGGNERKKKKKRWKKRAGILQRVLRLRETERGGGWQGMPPPKELLFQLCRIHSPKAEQPFDFGTRRGGWWGGVVWDVCEVVLKKCLLLVQHLLYVWKMHVTLSRSSGR